MNVGVDPSKVVITKLKIDKDRKARRCPGPGTASPEIAAGAPGGQPRRAADRAAGRAERWTRRRRGLRGGGCGGALRAVASET